MQEKIQAPQSEIVALAIDIVSAYVSNNSLPLAELPALIGSVHAALTSLTMGESETVAAPEVQKPTAAQIRKSVTHDALISFEDGKSYRTLRRHLTAFGLTPETYRAKWGLPVDYPMVAASYSEQRSALAKSIGLGRPGRASAADEKSEPAEQEPKARGRRKTAA